MFVYYTKQLSNVHNNIFLILDRTKISLIILAN